MPLSMTTNSPTVSIVVPLYNEEESAPVLHKAIHQAMECSTLDFEILFVDDGSKDSTVAVCTELCRNDPRLRLIQFRRNYGQTPAMAAGIDNAKGEILVTMDGDLQNDPSDIPMMIDKLNQGFDIVVGWRHNRQDKLFSRKIPSVIANRLIGKVTGVPIKDNGCSLKVYRADVMKKMPFYSEMHRFIPALLSLSGARVAEVKVKHHARQFGESSYGLSRIYKVLLDLLTMKTILSLVDHPTTWFGKLSLLPFVISLVSGLILLGLYINNDKTMVMASITMVFLSLGGFILSLGFLCEMIYQKGSLKINKLALLTADITNTQTRTRQIHQ
jgi:glycosyltransferase involved in cell wall biosynthesis